MNKEQRNFSEITSNSSLNTLKSKNKRQKSNSPIINNITSKSFIELYQTLYLNSKPYSHSFLYPLLSDNIMREIYNESKNNMTATFKETDLFKLFQTCDLGNLNENDELALRMPQLMNLRKTLYSREFRDFIMGKLFSYLLIIVIIINISISLFL